MQCPTHWQQSATLIARLSQAEKFGLTAAVLVPLSAQADVFIATVFTATKYSCKYMHDCQKLEGMRFEHTR